MDAIIRTRLVVGLIAALVSACGDDGGSSNQCSSLLPGDLVITEVFSDPDGPDEGAEWFELYNAGTKAVTLSGITVAHSRGDGTMRDATVLGSVTVAAGDFVVLGNTLGDLAPAWVDIGYADGLGDLYNTGTGRIALQCGTDELDAITYAAGRSGRSHQLDGGQAPDYTINDDLEQWCNASNAAENEFSPKNFGTPGAVNEDCQIIVPGMCDDGVSLRPIMAPLAGDLVITEVMTNPAAVSDALGEWFEVQATRDVDLNGLQLDRMADSSGADELVAEACLHVTAGTNLVFARSVDAGVNGGLPRVDGVFGFTVVSGSSAEPGDIALLHGGTLIDAVTWTSSRTGKALQVDPDSANATANDVAANFCDAIDTYGEGDLGTPGAPNAQCPLVAPPGSCLDGTTPRALVTPVPGDLVITEVMPSPNAVSDTSGEWFEVIATRDVDLNGLGLDRASDTANPNVVSSAACLRLANGQRAIFARSTSPDANGGLPAVTAAFTFSLTTGTTTTPGDVQIVYDGEVLDAVTWTGSTSGASLQLDPDFTNTADNDLETSWCDGATAYGAGDLGTPLAANAQCTGGPAPGSCLANGVARALVLPVPGDLVITEVMASPSAVSDTLGEWFEVQVTRDVDLNGLGLSRASSTSPTVVASADCIRVTNGSRLVFAHSADSTLNGGLPAVTATFTFALVGGSTTSPGDIRLSFAGTTLDSFVWTRSTAGASLQLDPDMTNPTDNDDEQNWCDATAAYGDGDLGTPALANAQCASQAQPGTCSTGAGTRAIVKPSPGQLVITEIMPNPKTEPGQEWFEILNTGSTSFDLNELGLDRAGDTRAPDVVTSSLCKPVPQGTYALLARSTDMAINGGIATVDATFGFSMVNTSGDVRVLDGMTVLDAVTWSSSTDGVSSQLDPDQLTSTANDTAANFCASTANYGDNTNKGTPRLANPVQCN